MRWESAFRDSRFLVNIHCGPVSFYFPEYFHNCLKALYYIYVETLEDFSVSVTNDVATCRSFCFMYHELEFINHHQTDMIPLFDNLASPEAELSMFYKTTVLLLTFWLTDTSKNKRYWFNVKLTFYKLCILY